MSDGGSTAATRGPLPSARHGRTSRPCRRSRSATISCSTTRTTPLPSYDCDDNELFRPADDGGVCGADRTPPGMVHALAPLQRLGPIRTPRPSRLERPALLRRGPGAALADRDGHGSRAVDPRGGLAAAAHLGHGDRQLRPDGRRLPRGLPHQPGRQQAADPRERRDAAGVHRHRDPARRDRARALRRRCDDAVDRVASGVRGREQRRLHRPVRVEGQRGGDRRTTRPETRTTCSSASPTARSWRAEARRASRPSCARAAPRSPTSTSTGFSTSWSSTDASPSSYGATSGAAMRRRPRRWATGWRCGSSSRARTGTRSAPGSRCVQEAGSRAASSPSGAGTRPGSSAGRTSASAKRTVPRSA